MEYNKMAETQRPHMEMRWVPVVDDKGHTRMEVRWITLSHQEFLHQAA